MHAGRLESRLCHDIEEDVEGVSREDVAAVLGIDAEAIVYACTGEGANRTERQASIVRKLKANPKAALVKLADRVCNMECCLKEGKYKLLSTYAKEIALYDEIFKASDADLYARFAAFKTVDFYNKN